MRTYWRYFHFSDDIDDQHKPGVMFYRDPWQKQWELTLILRARVPFWRRDFKVDFGTMVWPQIPADVWVSFVLRSFRHSKKWWSYVDFSSGILPGVDSCADEYRVDRNGNRIER